MTTYKSIAPVKLAPIDKSGLLHYMLWRNKEEIMVRNRQWRLLNLEDQEKWYDDLMCQKWPEHLMFNIEAQLHDSNLHSEPLAKFFTKQFDDKENEDMSWHGVGVCGLCYIDYIARSAEVSIYIGSQGNQRKGIGTKAITRLKEWAFDKMNLEKLWAEVYDNAASVMRPFFVANDFYETGYVADTVFKNGGHYGSTFYSYYISDWRDKSDAKKAKDAISTSDEKAEG